MREARGLPIAAYLGMLVVLALAAAFVASLAIVIFLPPRPPDVLRADKVAEHFQEGYDEMTALGRLPNGRGVIWEVRASPPEKTHSPYMHMTQRQLAGARELEPDQVRLAAAHVATDDTFVFRVLDIEAFNDHILDADEVAQIAEETRRAHEEAAERLAEARERMEELEHARAEALD